MSAKANAQKCPPPPEKPLPPPEKPPPLEVPPEKPPPPPDPLLFGIALDVFLVPRKIARWPACL
jgi:hypothetical protein